MKPAHWKRDDDNYMILKAGPALFIAERSRHPKDGEGRGFVHGVGRTVNEAIENCEKEAA